MIALITGGSKSGKSTYAEKLARALADNVPVTYIATMRVTDDEDQLIVQRHKKQREGHHYIVFEQEKCLSDVAVMDDVIVLLEDIPNLLANEMFFDGHPDTIIQDIQNLSVHARHLVIITNEVGSDGIAYDEKTMEYIHRLHRLNNAIAVFSDHVVEVVCGIPLCIKGEML